MSRERLVYHGIFVDPMPEVLHASDSTRSTAAAAVAFVIPVRDDARRLQTCLQSLAGAAGATAADVLVLDHGSRDGSDQVARDAGARVLTHHGGNVASLRNIGAAATSAPLIAFVDADNELSRGWLDAAVAAIGRPGVGMVGLAYHAPPAGTWVQRTYDTLRRRPGQEEATEWLGAGNMMVRREAFESVGGFDETLETCEDVDLCARVIGRGWQVRAVPGMASLHHGDPARLGDVFWGEMWRGRDNLRVTLRGPKTVRSLVSAAMPVAWAGAMLAGVVGLLVRGRLGLAAAVLGVAGLAALLAVRIAAMRCNAGGRWPAGLWAALRVAAVYDAGRSAAVFVGVGHGRRRGTPGA